MRFPVVRHQSMYNGSNFVVPTDVDVPRFEAGSTEALDHLRREGYVVIKGILDADEVKTARKYLWSYLEGIPGVSRHDPSTWVLGRPNHYGIFWQHGAGHSRLAWFVRTRPKLLQMFSAVWNTSDLLASFEGFSMFPPKRVEPSWQIGESWFHIARTSRTCSTPRAR